MRTKIIILSFCLLYATMLRAQNVAHKPTSTSQTLWSLTDCIEYAQKNNISVQQRALNVEDEQVQLSTARYNRLPDLNASLSANASFGRGLSRNNTYVDANQVSGSLGVSASMPIFHGMRINEQIKSSKLNLAAAVQDLERVREDLSINVMTLYLQVLFNKELVGVAQKQLSLSSLQTERSRQLVATGKSPESAIYESVALQAKDELNLTQSRNELMLSLLNLRQALNREDTIDFDVQVPILDSLTIASMIGLSSPNAVYDYAVENRPHVKAEQLRLQSSETSVRIAKANLYPSISLSGGYGTNLYKSYITGALTNDFWFQFANNGNEYVGLSVSIPIFNRLSTRNNIRSAKISMHNRSLALVDAKQALRKEIEQAYYNANAAYDKYQFAGKALVSARVAFTYEQNRAEAGRSTIFDYNDAKTRMERAESELIQAKYDFIFRSKILDYYKGIPITLG
ncbi:MAG: TolC family protein [Rikenellaceae bacterium]